MAKQVQQPAKGNSGNTAGPVVTPAPTKRVIPQAPDQVTMVRKPSAIGYGMNRDVSPSSIAPGQQRLSPLAANLKASGDDGEGVLDTVVAKGTARVDTEVTTQLRDIAAKACPPTFGMKDPNANNPKVPSALGASNGAPVRKPS
jgi:hypothetical protein